MTARSALFVAAVAAALVPGRANAAARLTGADVRVVFESPLACTVELGVTLTDAAQVEHRVEIADGGRVDLIEVTGATPAGPPTDIGRTRALTLRPEGASYTLRYRVQLPEARSGRCPLWIPTVAAAVTAAPVRVTARLPQGARAAGTMPTFRWTGDEGTATIGHLPAFVRVPYAMPGEPAPWNIAQVMDYFSVVTLVVATLGWLRRQRHPQAPSPKPQAQDHRTSRPQDLAGGLDD